MCYYFLNFLTESLVYVLTVKHALTAIICWYHLLIAVTLFEFILYEM